MFTKDGDTEHVHMYRNEIRRKVHIMLAFIRQNTRESHVGFQPGSSEGKTPFHVGNNYVRDPTRPRLCDLLTPTEVEAYGRLMVSARAACVASEIKGIVQLLAKHVDYNIMMYTKVSQCLQIILDGQETLFRIITTPLPFPYHWILNAMLIVFGACVRVCACMISPIDDRFSNPQPPPPNSNPQSTRCPSSTSPTAAAPISGCSCSFSVVRSCVCVD
jgi:hypothetical protein